jgi:diguanylate cyclase (GGDEF)-like protein
VDNLKKYNDRNGHLRGSFLLREIAQLFTKQVRSWDLVAKYGGDEFMVILPRTEADGAVVMAERIRSAVEKQPFANVRPGDITISIGISTFPAHGLTVRDLVASADEALFQAKRAGRNCVRSATVAAAA